ncbi:abortive phage infection protein [Mycobacterium sp. MS1601]|uniref:Rv0804 family intramembrane glutamic endopeptidase n=1 Tax=Mycobacterium sp. MS1601 TaxID=1936029 RepID=UPI0009797872|nr:CPBP family intramembrane glutamic endopeptidase [Mycobacterium sp. MS1601]AQA02433.1 abortive phage infection protein [Mycobacterium sp. MS1601]
MNRDQRRALAFAAGLVGWSLTAGLQIPGRRHPLIQAGLGTGLALAAGARPRPRSGVAHGVAAAAVVAAGVAATTALPQVRKAMRERELPTPAWWWLAVEIPLGTVWSEEAAYRGVLGVLAARGFGTRRGKLLQAMAFGLSHIADARAAGEPVVGTVLVTGLAGWVFAMLAERSGSLLAPALAHLAVNEAGALAALLVQAHDGRLG